MGGGPDAAEGEFVEQGAFVDFLEEAGAESVGDFEDCGENAPGERIAVAGFMDWTPFLRHAE